MIDYLFEYLSTSCRFPSILLMWSVIAFLMKQLNGSIFPSPFDAFRKLMLLFQGEALYNHTIYNHFLKILFRWGAGKFTIFFKVLIPAATLSIIDGLRIGLANAWRVLIAAEMIVGVGVGLGYIIIQARWSLKNWSPNIPKP